MKPLRLVFLCLPGPLKRLVVLYFRLLRKFVRNDGTLPTPDSAQPRVVIPAHPVKTLEIPVNPLEVQVPGIFRITNDAPRKAASPPAFRQYRLDTACTRFFCFDPQKLC